MSDTNAKSRTKGKGKPESIKLGLMPPLTGVVGFYGEEIARAGQIACAEVNESGGVLGCPLELIIEDDGSLPETSVAAAQRLVRDYDCVAIIGNLLSNSRISVAYRVAEPQKIPYLNFSFYEGSILSRYFFHFAALPNQQIDKMIPFMQNKYGSRMFFAGNNYEWPRGSIAAAKAALEANGGEVVGEQYTDIGVKESVIEDLLDDVERISPDVFVPYFAGTDQINLLTSFSERGMKSRVAVVMGHYDEMMASKLPPEVREGFYSTNTYFMTVNTEANKNYLRRLSEYQGVTANWPEGNGILTNFGEGAYLCVKAFANAANKAGSVDPESLVETLRGVKIDGPQGMVEMEAATHHAKVNTFLSRCNRQGKFEIVESFGSIPPVIPERYRHQRVAEKETVEEEMRLQARIIEQLAEAVLLVNFENEFLYNNNGAGVLLESDQDLHGRKLDEFVEREVLAKLIYELKIRGYWQGQLTIRSAKGNTFHCHCRFSSFTHPGHGEVWLAALSDISPRVEMENRLKESEKRLQFLSKFSPAVIYTAEAKHPYPVKFISDNVTQLLGYAPQDVIAQKMFWIDHVHPDDRKRANENLDELFTKGEMKLEYRFQFDDGKSSWLQHDLRLVKSENESAKQVIGFVRDVTSRKRAELALLESEERLRRVIEIINDGIWDWNLEEKAVYLSSRWKDILGYQDHELENTESAMFDRVHPDDLAALDKALKWYLEDGKPYQLNLRMSHKDGDYRWILARGQAYRNKQGETVRVLGTITDIHENKLNEEKLKQYYEQLERQVEERTHSLKEALEAKDLFLSRVSHELRTPLNAIMGFSQILGFQSSDPSVTEAADEIRRAGDHLLELINELLDVAIIESGKMNIVVQPTLLSSVINQACRLIENEFRERNLKLRVEPCHDLYVLADSSRLRQILLNLLSNAAKYNRPGGSAQVRCQRVADNKLRIEVVDTGLGIKPDQLKRIFEPFDRLGAEYSGETGTGIGLTLSKQLCELMGGQMGLESEKGAGSTFWVELPQSENPEALDSGETGAVEVMVSRFKILYIEDNSSNLRVVKAMLRQRTDYELISAVNGEEGLELAKETLPDLILLDINLPVMNGYEVLEKLRADTSTLHIPVVALSADAMPQDKEKGYQAGFKHYLTKPLDMEDLFAVLDEELEAEEPG